MGAQYPKPHVRVIAFFSNYSPVLAYVDEGNNWMMDVLEAGSRPIFQTPRVWRYLSEAAAETYDDFHWTDLLNPEDHPGS